MAAIAGKGGSIVCSSAQTYVKSWTINHDGPAIDVTTFDSSGYRDHIAGILGWGGSFACNWSTANNIAMGTSVKGKFRLGSTGASAVLHGKIIVTNCNYGCDVAGVITQDYTFVGCLQLNTSST